MFHTLQSALETGHEAWSAQMYYSAAYFRVNHQGILYEVCSVVIGGSVLSVLTKSLSNRTQHATMDGCWSNW